MAILEQGMVFDGDTPCLPGPQPPLGYIYIAEFASGGVPRTTVTVGRSVNPQARMKDHDHLTRIWVSPPHLTYIANELKLIRAVARMDHPTFDDAIAAAQHLNYGTDPISHLSQEIRRSNQ